MRPRTPVDAIAACIASATQESVDTLSAALERLDAIEGVDQPAVRTLALAHVGRCYGTLGDWDAATWYLQQALRWARQLGVPEARIELLCDLAEICVQRAGQPAHAAGAIDADRDAEQARLHATRRCGWCARPAMSTGKRGSPPASANCSSAVPPRRAPRPRSARRPAAAPPQRRSSTGAPEGRSGGRPQWPRSAAAPAGDAAGDATGCG